MESTMSGHDPQNKPFPLCIMLTCRNMPKSVAFYRDTLGFTLEHSWPEGDAPMWANMMLDRQSIMLGASMDPGQAPDCGGDAATKALHQKLYDDFKGNKPGIGFMTYVLVPDVDAFHSRLSKAGLKPEVKPTTQFYGIRDFSVLDPDGYRLIFYSPVVMTSCGSCGIPLTDAQEGEMYCRHCVDAQGKLKSYDDVLEGTIQGYFMEMQKMPRAKAEVAARAHLAKMPAWVHQTV
jgi:catechol 2,3-dioxygenase-like lactoylglutathione lyase family enzyme